MSATRTRYSACLRASRRCTLAKSPARGALQRLVAQWRVSTILNHTVDEYGVLFRSLFSMDDLDASGIHGIVISSVVPPLDSTLRQVCERYFKLKPLFVEPGVKTGMPVHYENPAEVGADRIVNGVAAFEKYGGPCVVVDFGTATTFDCVSAKGEYMGGVICPGIGISADALFQRTARLPRVDIRKPARVVGTTTVGSLQSGLYYGYLGLVDGILEQLLAEMGKDTKVIATGGLASMIGTASKYIKTVDDHLTLRGLAHHLRAQHVGPARREEQDRKTGQRRQQTLQQRQAPHFLSLARGKLLQLLHRNRRTIPATSRREFCCSRRSTGR